MEREKEREAVERNDSYETIGEKASNVTPIQKEYPKLRTIAPLSQTSKVSKRSKCTILKVISVSLLLWQSFYIYFFYRDESSVNKVGKSELSAFFASLSSLQCLGRCSSFLPYLFHSNSNLVFQIFLLSIECNAPSFLCCKLYLNNDH